MSIEIRIALSKLRVFVIAIGKGSKHTFQSIDRLAFIMEYYDRNEITGAYEVVFAKCYWSGL